MKRLSTLLAAVAALLALVLIISAAAAKAPPQSLKHVGLPVVSLAMDGPRVIYSSDDNAVRVWDMRSGAITQLRRGAGRFTDNPSIRQVAIAGQRAAWITIASVGNSQETTARLFTASLATRRADKIASAFRVFGYDDSWKGDWLSGLAGSGNVLAVSRWRTTPNADSIGSTISNARLSLIEPGRPPLRMIASGTRSIVSAAVDAGRIAVLRPDHSVGIYSANGALVREITPSSAKELAFGGGRVAVLTETKTLEVFNAQSGALLHTWPVATKSPDMQAENLSAYGRIGVYLATSDYVEARRHVIDLSSGKEMVLSASWYLGRDAVVGRLGLVYAVNRLYFGVQPPKRTGTLVFLPTAKVLSMLAPAKPARTSSLARASAESQREAKQVDTRIVFSNNHVCSWNDCSRGEIAVVNLNGTGFKRLTHNLVSEESAAWSPKKQRIAFYRNLNIWVMDAKGHHQRRLSGTAYANEPDWSPSGQSIVFSGGSGGAGVAGLWTVNVRTGRVKRLISGEVSYDAPCWSPDGTRIAFGSNRSGTEQIWTLRLRDRRLTQLTQPVGEPPTMSYTPAWSPDGRRLAVWRAGHIWTIRSDGSHARPVGVAADEFTWSADGKWIVFSAGSLYAIHPDGSGRRVIRHEAGGPSGWVDLGPDG